jgi:competence protein ComEC
MRKVLYFENTIPFMASAYPIPFWKSSPFVRILIPFTAGIAAQWYLNMPLPVTLIAGFCFIVFFFLLRFLSDRLRYKFASLQGMLLHLIIFCIGTFITWHNDIRNDQWWFGNYYTDSTALIIRITEPPLPKERSFKAEGIVESVTGVERKLKGKVLIYFSQAESASLPKYGDEILITDSLIPIKNSGNPGAFDYKRYTQFQQIFHQVFLKRNQYVLLKEHRENPLYSFIYFARQKVVSILQQYVRSDKRVTGIAEALLIGYKEDLDKDIVQSYSNTGVVHIIAISGMHLGLIYIVLVWIFSRLPVIKRSSVIRVILILFCLWLFSLITGASASVLRSAVMFTCIIIGKEFFRKAGIYNSIAASAFLLLVYDPYLLWDVGFQLSYFAVGGIIWLQKPVYNLLYVKNKVLRYIWEMCAITIAAQILTFPICIYYFHQFPASFLFTNLICVPLSTIILFAEIGLVILSWIPPVADMIGKLIYVLTWLMNTIIRFFDKMPGSLIDRIYATPLSTWLLYLLVFCTCGALLYKSRLQLKIGLLAATVFAIVIAYGKINLYNQKKIIIYNVSRHTAVDFISGNKYWFRGDDTLTVDGSLQNFNLKPARVSMQVSLSNDTLSGMHATGKILQFGNRKIMLADTAISFEPLLKKIEIDILLISHNPKIRLSNITSAVNPAIVVIDGSNNLWKIVQLKKECSGLHLRCYTVSEQGAFVLNAQ